MTLAELIGLVRHRNRAGRANTAAMSIPSVRSEIGSCRSLGFPSGVILSLLVGDR